jgi:hypothetical protein
MIYFVLGYLFFSTLLFGAVLYLSYLDDSYTTVGDVIKIFLVSYCPVLQLVCISYIIYKIYVKLEKSKFFNTVAFKGKTNE